MSENNCSSTILATKHFGFKSGQMQAVVAIGSNGFKRKCRRGFTALRFNGLLKQKCKKGMRRKYPLIVKSDFNLWR